MGKAGSIWQQRDASIKGISANETFPNVLNTLFN
jgi:hypothetical protein